MTPIESKKIMRSKNYELQVQNVKVKLDILSGEIMHPLCYSEAAYHVGLPACRKNRYCSGIIIRALNLMCKEDRLENRPFRATMFVSKNHGIPGTGFWESVYVGLDWVDAQRRPEAHEALLAEFLVFRKSLSTVRRKHNPQKQDCMTVRSLALNNSI